MSRYTLTIEAESLAELTGRVTEAAAQLQAGDADRTIARELAPLAEGEPLPLPPPNYQAAGLTEWQAAQVRAAQAELAVPPMPTPPPEYAPAVAAVAAQWVPPPQPAAVATAAPPCPLGHGAMEWKGGGLSKNGKGLPLWGCRRSDCREAIWPPR
jgi:hypothetical protein